MIVGEKKSQILSNGHWKGEYNFVNRLRKKKSENSSVAEGEKKNQEFCETSAEKSH